MCGHLVKGVLSELIFFWGLKKMKKIILLTCLVAGGGALSATAFANNWLLYLPAILAGSQGGGDVDPPVVTGVLNDTGIVLNSAGETCGPTSEEDCRYGRDATVSEPDPPDGHAGFSFTKLDSNGDALADQTQNYETNPWACVRDNVTGLVWEVKTTANADDKYNLATATTYVEETFAGCGTTYTVCRLPTVKELLGIVSLGSAGNIDQVYFPNTVTNKTYLSATKIANDTGTESAKVWGVDFTYGSTSSLPGINDVSYRVRAVCTAGGE